MQIKRAAQSEHIQDIQKAIQRLHGVSSEHLESVPVKEVFQGNTVWDGVVEVFTLKGHPQTDKLYAWAHDTDDPKKPKRHVTVLHVEPVTSPALAVRAFIVQEYRNAEAAEG